MLVEARRNARVVGDVPSKIVKPLKSPSPERKYVGLDKVAQERYHDRVCDYKGGNRRVSPTPDHYKSYSSTKDAHLSDEELGIMASEAWRSHLRNMHDYLPDRKIPPATHLDHVKVLNAAITDYKRQWSNLGLYGKGLLDYKHDQYALICRKYNIPAETCSPKELMDAVERKDMNVVYRKRCIPINKFCSMIIKGTPGYISAPDRSPERDSGPPSRAKEKKAIRKPLPKSYAHRSDGKFHPKEDPIRQDASSSVIRKNPAVNPMAGRSDNTPWSYSPSAGTKLEQLIRKAPVDPATADLSERRAKNMHRDMRRGQRFNPNAGEEKGYSSESGNELEDFDNSQYDSRMLPADKKILADVSWKIKSIKTKVLHKEYTTQRQNALENAQAEFEVNGKIPVYLHDVKATLEHWSGISHYTVQ
jgi:hypothetical protein